MADRKITQLDFANATDLANVNTVIPIVNPDETLDVDKNKKMLLTSVVQQTDVDGAALLPVGDDADRPTPAAGMLRFNTDSGLFEGYDGVDWGSIGGVVEFTDANNILATQVFG